MLELEPPVHTRLRTLVNRAFVSRQVERLRPRIEALANDLIDSFPTGGPVDLLPAFASPLPITIIAEMLGVPVEMGPQLLDWSHQMVAMYMHGRTAARRKRPPTEPRGSFPISCAPMSRSVARSRATTCLSLLISAHEDGQKLSEDELVSSAILLLNAGHEATVHQTGNAVRTILAQGGDPRRFFASPEATAATVEECLRIDAPLHMFTRYAYGEIEVATACRCSPATRSACCSAWPITIPRFRRAGGIPAGPFRPEERLVRRRHPLLHRRAARPARTASFAEDAVRPAAAIAMAGSRNFVIRFISMGWRGCGLDELRIAV